MWAPEGREGTSPSPTAMSRAFMAPIPRIVFFEASAKGFADAQASGIPIPEASKKQIIIARLFSNHLQEALFFLRGESLWA